jgi:hypothetical protein
MCCTGWVRHGCSWCLRVHFGKTSDQLTERCSGMFCYERATHTHTDTHTHTHTHTHTQQLVREVEV